MATEKTPRRLGRGLEALLGSATGLASSDEGALKSIPIAQISSISLMIAKNLGWKEIAAIIKEIDDRTLLTLALIENLQRTDLNPIEEGEGYHQLASQFGLTQQQIAETVGKDRTTVANVLRLLQLPEPARRLLQEGHLTMGHAKVLLGLEDSNQIVVFAREIVADGLTVRQVERRLRDVAGPKTGKKVGRPRAADRQSPEVRRIEDRLRRFLQTDIVLKVGAGNGGSLSIQFYSADDLERVLARIGVPD